MSVDISIIIPYLNEEDNSAFLVDSLGKFFKENRHINYEVILVDDGSIDNSSEAFETLLNKSGINYKIIILAKNYGSHIALRSGITNASGEWMMFLPADLQDPLELSTLLLANAKKGFDIVFASRNTTSAGIFEKSFSKMYATLMRKFVYKKFPENGFDIVMFNRKVQAKLNQNVEANSSIFLQILTLGYKQSFITYDKTTRKHGKSKWTLSKKIKLLVDSFVAFSYAPIRFVSLIGLMFFVVGIAWTLYISARKLMFNDIAAGWPALTSILLLGFGITNISLGIIAEYLWRTLDASRARPVFIIDKIIENKKEQ